MKLLVLLLFSVPSYGIEIGQPPSTIAAVAKEGDTMTGQLTTTVSSAPLVNVSTLSTTGILTIYSKGGFLTAEFDGATGGTGGLRVNRGTAGGSQIGNLEIFDTASPDFYFRRNDTSINAGDITGRFNWRDNDSSTGGSTVKHEDRVEAAEDWGSNGQMELRRFFAFARRGATLYDGIVMTSTGTSLGAAGSATNTPVPTTALSVYGVVTSSTAIPTSTCDAGTPIVGANSTNQHGAITSGALATACTVTFSAAWPKTPVCTFITDVAVGSPRMSAISTTAVTFNATSLNGAIIYYQCMGAP